MPLEIALLGCGHPHVSDVLGVIASEPDLRLAAAWDADPAAVPGPISSHAVLDLDTAIRRADAVVICAPTDQRPGLCVRAARAGRPILVEVPVAGTGAAARAAAREITRSRTPAYATLYLRELPALARLREVIRAGLLGRPSTVSVSYLRPSALNGSLGGASSWMLDRRRSGAGALVILGTHLVDGLAALGRVPVMIGAVTPDRGQGARMDLGGTAVGRWGDVPLSLRTSWAARPEGLEFQINGTTASAVLRDGSLEILAGEGSRERWIGAPPDAGESLRAFAQRLRRRRLELEGLEGAISAQETIERAVVLS
jgi:predicted dehydrogenase